MNLRMVKKSAVDRIEPEGLPLSGVARHPTVAECQRMERDGYLIVRHFFGTNQVADLLRWAMELETKPEVPGQHWVYREDSQTEPGRRRLQGASRPTGRLGSLRAYLRQRHEDKHASFPPDIEREEGKTYVFRV
jgi:hypothetical protein